MIPRWRVRFRIFNKPFVVSTGFIYILLITSIKIALCLIFLKIWSFNNVRLIRKKWKDKKFKEKSPKQRPIFQNKYKCSLKREETFFNFVSYISMMTLCRAYWNISPITCPWRYPRDTWCFMNISLISTPKKLILINVIIKRL